MDNNALQSSATADELPRMRDFLSGLSAQNQRDIKRGLDIVGGVLDKDRWETLLPLIEKYLAGEDFPSDAAAQTYDLTTKQLSNVSLATSVLASFIRADSECEQIKTAITEITKHEWTARSDEYLQYLNSRSQSLKSIYVHTKASTAVLPSLDEFDIVVDIRMTSKPGESATLTPVVIAYLQTDAVGQKLWCQMSKGQLKRFREAFEAAWNDLAEAERICQSIHSV